MVQINEITASTLLICSKYDSLAGFYVIENAVCQDLIIYMHVMIGSKKIMIIYYHQQFRIINGSADIFRRLYILVDAGDNGIQAGSCEEGVDKSESDGTVDIISWIVVSSKEKVLEIVEKIIEFVNEWLQSPEEEKTSEGNTDPFEEKLRTCFFLSIVVLLVVVVARAHCVQST